MTDVVTPRYKVGDEFVWKTANSDYAFGYRKGEILAIGEYKYFHRSIRNGEALEQVSYIAYLEGVTEKPEQPKWVIGHEYLKDNFIFRVAVVNDLDNAIGVGNSASNPKGSGWIKASFHSSERHLWTDRGRYV